MSIVNTRFLFKGIMKDKWMNMSYEEEELKPFIEPVMDLSDEKRIEMLVRIFLSLFFIYLFILHMDSNDTSKCKNFNRLKSTK